MTKLEDLLLPDNLQVKKKSLESTLEEYYSNATPEQVVSEFEALGVEFIPLEEHGLNAIIDDGGITNIPLALDEIMELESRNYPDAAIDEEHFVDHEEYHFDPVWFKENRLKVEGETDSVTFDYNISEQPEFQGSELQKSLIEMEREITHQVRNQISETLDREIMGIEAEEFDEIIELNKLPLYLLNDPEIVGYPDEEFQEEIYEWVAGKLPRHHFSVKDLGSGRGDFYRVLSRHTGYSDDRIGIDYFGIESNPNLCQVGEQKYPGIKLINNDFNDVSIQTDYTICIGTLNDDHGFDKWEYFNKTLNHALNNTKTAILFVLQANCYGEQGHLDYPIPPLVSELPHGIGWEIDNSRFEDIYLLTVHIGSFN